MPTFLHVTEKEIGELGEVELVDLLQKLLVLEASKSKIRVSGISVSLNTKAIDGGEDASISWKGVPDRTTWIPNKNTIFQCKAAVFGPSKCKKEILTKGGKAVKPHILSTLKAGGAYVLVNNGKLGTKETTERVKAFREGLKLAGSRLSKNAQIEVYGASLIARWTNEHLAAVTYLKSLIGKTFISGMIPWVEWQNKQANKIPYTADVKLSAQLQQLRDVFRDPANKVVRIVGLSGLGKSRLAFEAFRPPLKLSEDPYQQALSDSVVYINNADTQVSGGWLRDLRVEGINGVVVVDNCDGTLHSILADEIKQPDSRLGLITIDYDPESIHFRDPVIQLKPFERGSIGAIVKAAFPTLRQNDIETIIDLAEGFPQIAALLAEARFNDEKDIGTLKDDDLIKKMLWGRKQENQDALDVISACAVFDRLGFDGDVKEERKFVARNFCRLPYTKKDKEDRFYSLAQQFLTRGILDRRNRYVRVVPRPLAVRLAADWWRLCPPDKAVKLLTSHIPKELGDALCLQMRMLSDSPDALRLTATLCGPQAPFGQAKILNSAEGSRIFRALVEVNPHATASAIYKAFHGWPIKELRKIGPGRRDLVWSLERLCFWDGTFEEAAKVLALFAAAENETWGNNATNQFLQLFHIRLSGTQAPPAKRLQIIDWALNGEFPELIALGIMALGSSLEAIHFTRMGGVETQGGRAPQEDWQPKIWKDAFSYWRESLKRLIPFAQQEDAIGNLARKQIVDHFRGLVRHGRVDELENALEQITAKYPHFWLDGYQAVQETLRWEGNEIPEVGKARIETWLGLLKPKSLRDLLYSTVSMPDWVHDKQEDGHYVDVATQEAIEMAKNVLNDLPAFTKELDILLVGEQRKTGVFAQELGKLLPDPQSFVDECLAMYSQTKDANFTFIAGLLSGIQENNPTFVTKTLDQLVESDENRWLVLPISWSIRVAPADLVRVLRVVQEGGAPVERLKAFSYVRTVDDFSTTDLLTFLEEVLPLAPEIALAIVFGFINSERQRLDECIFFLKILLLDPKLLPSIRENSNSDWYHWEKIALTVINRADQDFVENFSKRIIEYCGTEGFVFAFQHSAKSVLAAIFKRYPTATWPLFADSLGSSSWRLKFHIEHILEPELTYKEEGRRSPLDCLPSDYLVSWCNSNERAELISKIILPIEMIEKSWRWTPLAIFLLETFSSNNRIVYQLFGNLEPRSWVGSRIPDLRFEIEQLEKIQSTNAQLREKILDRIRTIENQIEEEQRQESERDFGIF